MPSFATYKTTNVSYFPLVSSKPAWKLDFSGNVWDAVMDVLTANVGAALADPGSNGIVKRTSLNVTAVAVAGTDYQTPLVAGTDYVAAPGAWQTATLINSWANSNTGTYNAARYRKEGDVVRLSGDVNTGANNTVAFVLAVGFRPAKQIEISTWNNGGNATGRVTIDTSGNVTPVGSFGTVGNVSLEGVTFPLT